MASVGFLPRSPQDRSSAMPSLTLTYFDMPGRARVLRHAMALGGVAFEDRALPRDGIAALKPSLPYGMVPILSIDGEVIAEAQAILRYIGRITGAYPRDPLAAAMVDEVLDSFDDLNERLLIPTYQEDDVEKKKALRLRLISGELRDALALLDQRMQQLQTVAFFATHKETVFIHELVVWDFVLKFRSDGLDHIPPTFVDAFPTLVAVHSKVENATAIHRPQNPLAAVAVAPSALTLTSLDKAIPDRVTPLRLALRLAGLEFHDERLPLGACHRRKTSWPNAQLPVVTVNGQCVAQSIALLRYVGTIGGSYPTDNLIQAAKIDEVLSHIGELYFFFDPVYQNLRPEATLGIQKALADDVVAESLEALDKRLDQWHPEKAFAMGTAMTVADLAIYGLVELLLSGELTYMPTTVVTPYKRLVRVHEAVRKAATAAPLSS